MILAALLLIAQTAPEDCADPMTQLEMNVCANREFLQADARLNRVWKQVAAEMKRRDADMARDGGRPGYFAQLLAAQRAWLAYRDAHCASEGYLTRGGSMEPMMILTCKTALTETRTAELQDLMDWPN